MITRAAPKVASRSDAAAGPAPKAPSRRAPVPKVQADPRRATPLQAQSTPASLPKASASKSPAPTHSLESIAAPAALIEVARVLGAWGVQGWVKLTPHSADPQALFATKRWYLTPPTASDDAPAAGASVSLLKVRQAREHSSAIVAQADEITDRDQAQALKGWRVWVPRTSFPTPEADEYYWVDLIGLAVRNRQGIELGQVAELLPTGPQTTLVVRPHATAAQTASADLLIPFVSVYVDAVNLAERRIDVDWQIDD